MSNTDFLIIGGGAYGCAVAYHLSKHGADVTLLERHVVASGSSGGPGKRGIRGNKRDIRELPLVAEAYALWPDLSSELDGETGYENTGGVYLIEHEISGLSGGIVAAKHRAGVQTNFGVPTELWDRSRLIERLPGLSSRVKAGLYAPKDGIASHSATTTSYAAAAEKLGTVLIENTEVSRLLQNKSGRVIGVRTIEGTEFFARRGILLANNTGCADLLSTSLGVHLPVWSVFPQALALSTAQELQLPLLVGHDNRRLSVKQTGFGKIMLTGGWRGLFDIEKGSSVLVEENVRGNIDELRAVFPQLTEISVDAGYVDRAEAVSLDEIPLIGEIKDGLHIAVGWSAHGWALVPSVSRHIARILWENHGQKELVPFSPSRFGKLLTNPL